MATFDGNVLWSDSDFWAQSSPNPSNGQVLTALVVPDAIAPTISDIDPAPGAVITAASIVHFSITDETLLGFVEVQVDQVVREVVHDGDVFVSPYLSSTRETISGGWRYHVQRSGGWRVAPLFRVRAFDGAPNEGAI